MILFLDHKKLSTNGKRNSNNPRIEDFIIPLNVFIYCDIIVYENPKGEFKILKNRYSSTTDLKYFELIMKNNFDNKEWFFLKSNNKEKDVNCVY